MERAAVHFASAAAVAALVQRVVAPLGLRVDESRPWVDARLPGGERFHAVLPPLAPDGPVVAIRTFARRRLELRDLIDRGALDAATARLLEAMVAAGIAIAVSGATGTGKTTLLNVLERHRQRPALGGLRAARSLVRLAWLREQQPVPQQRRPGLPAHDPVDRQVLVLLETPDRRLSPGPKYPIHVEVVHTRHEVEHELQAFDRWLAGVLPPPEDRKAEGDLNVGLWSAHRDPLPSPRFGD
jgi:hypothetical protein